MAEIKVFVLVDEGGDYACGADEDAARERYAEDISDSAACVRMIEITLQVPEPKPIQLAAIVPADAIPPVAVQMTVQA